MSVKQITESKYFKVAAITCGILLVALISFSAGLRVGSHRALFSANFGENYERNFLGGPTEARPLPPLGDMMDPKGQKGMRNPHGVGGEILSISGDTLVIKDKNDQESSIRVSDATIINRGEATIALSDLVVGDKIVVIGKPQDDGVVAAHLIRIFLKDKQSK
jgi:hypothetical protein